MRFRIISVALGLAASVAMVTPALANHNHPAKANKFLVLYVKAYNQCTNPSKTHNAPLAFPACTPVQADSSNSFGPKGSAQSIGVVKLNSAKQASDVQLIAKAADIRNGSDGTGTGFTGNLTVSGIIRSTDHFCTTPGECTLIDVPFPVQLPCTNGKCAAKTTANAVLAGSVVGGKQANVELQELQIYNGSALEFDGGIWLP
jgi:hypothetical protein